MLKVGVGKKLSFEKFDLHGIPLSELIAVEREFRPHSRLPGNLGDGFLCATNPVFRRIRKDVRRRGYSFSTQDLGGYFSFPLMSLDEAIDARKIPYRKNSGWLEKIEKSAPGRFTLTELKKSELKFNYLFHESAHCIAHDVLFGGVSVRRAPKNADSLLKIFLGEAFANSVEAFASVFAEGEIGAYFLDANCHFRANEREVRALRNGIRKFGPEATVLALMGAFLYSNYLFESLSAKQMGRIANLAGVKPQPSLSAIVRIGLQLNEEFRTKTTLLHLVKTGFPTRIDALLRGDPLVRVLKAPVLKRKMEELARIAVGGVKL